MLEKCGAYKIIKGNKHYCQYNCKVNGFCGYHKNFNLTKLKREKTNPDIKKEQIISITKIKKKEIIELLNFYKIPHVGVKRKENLYTKYTSLLNTLNNCKNNSDKIIKLQSIFRLKLVKLKLKYHGLCYFNKQKCNNQVDFYTFEPCESIENKYFFSYKDNDKFYYGFDVRSLHKLINNNILSNPYTTYKFSQKLIENINFISNRLTQNNYSLEYQDTTELTEEQKYTQKVIKIFQKIDDLNYITNITWFNNLNIYNLREFYKQLEDIWNYRANLTLDEKKKIIPDLNVFNLSVAKVFNIKSLSQLRSISLETIDKFISSGITKSDKSLGALYILSSLVIVSDECAQEMPFLVQNL